MKQIKTYHRAIFLFLIVQIGCFIFPLAIFCQSETLDIVTYTAPAGWTKTFKENAVVFSDLNKTTNVFCAVTIYSSSVASGNADKDFAAEWENLVAKPFQAIGSPKTETQNDDGWRLTSANAQIEVDGFKSLAFLVVYSGYGRRTSILAFLNSDTYLVQLGTFLKSVKLDKAQVASQKPAVSRTPVANSYDSAALVGRWGNGIAGDTVSGNTITYGSNATQQYYKFNADGTYSFVYSGYSGLAGQTGSFHVSTNEIGVYTLNGDSITITPKKSQTNSNSSGLRNNPLETVTYRWTIHYFEGVKEYSLVLHPDKQTNRDGGFSYGCLAFPNSYCYSQMK
ncbi:MAG: lipocalin family protein [Acidobacteriota bacterium]